MCKINVNITIGFCFSIVFVASIKQNKKSVSMHIYFNLKSLQNKIINRFTPLNTENVVFSIRIVAS